MSATKVVLTKDEAEHALLLFPKLPRDAALQRYALHKRILVSEGRIAPRPGGVNARDSREGR